MNWRKCTYIGKQKNNETIYYCSQIIQVKRRLEWYKYINLYI